MTRPILVDGVPSTKHPLHATWASMRHRCTCPQSPKWLDYGGRGITVCERWADFATFVADMGPKPSPSHQIDRINNEGGYSPDNCRWATAAEQAANRRLGRIGSNRNPNRGPSGPSTPRARRTRPSAEVTLSVGLLARLDALCREQDVSRSDAIKEALVLGLRSGALSAWLAQMRAVAEV